MTAYGSGQGDVPHALLLADSIWLALIVRRDLQRALMFCRGTVAAAARKNTTAGFRGPSALTAP
jgi:hypothetical protein